LDAPDKRKVWEGLLQWANKFSRIGSDNIARDQFNAGDFRIDAFIEMAKSYHGYGSESGGIVKGSGGDIALADKFVSMDISGDYYIDWSVSLARKSGPMRFAYGIPFIGNKVFGSAQDYKSQMGFYQNSQIDRTLSFAGSDFASSSKDEREDRSFDSEARYQRFGRTVRSTDPNPYTENTSYIVRHGIDSKTEHMHLSGSGAATIPAASGGIGVLILCDEGTSFTISGGSISLRRRLR
tara:strand:+ start:564 stop:1277 length:714 start_codon:yes stop_codon:yes gene_type:complete